MIYRCETTLPEVDLMVSGCNVGVIPDLDVTMILDEDGDLIEVEMTGSRQMMIGKRSELVTINSRSTNTNAVCIWLAASDHFTHNRYDIQDRAGVPKFYTHEFADEKLPQSAFI